MKSIRTFFFILTICLSTVLRAQFSSSQEVYCYQYVNTINDGIVSIKKDNIKFYFIFFQNDMMGKTYEYNARTVGQLLFEDPNYFRDKAKRDLTNRYERWTSSPETNGLGATIYKYNKDYSTISKYSYMEYYKKNQSVWVADGFIGHAVNRWSKPEWQRWVYSFSVDKSELIVWFKSDPEDRDIYKRIDPNSLKPDLDFLK